MESLHLTQQEFAVRTQIGAATLSNIFNDRTRPTLNVVELIKKNIPNISTDWLLMGVGQMYVDDQPSTDQGAAMSGDAQNQMLQFDDYASPTPSATVHGGANQPMQEVVSNETSRFSRSGRQEQGELYAHTAEEVARLMDKKPRRVTEIRVYYDDQTWESFAPSKSK